MAQILAMISQGIVTVGFLRRLEKTKMFCNFPEEAEDSDQEAQKFPNWEGLLISAGIWACVTGLNLCILIFGLLAEIRGG